MMLKVPLTSFEKGIMSESKKSSLPCSFLIFFPKRLEILINFLHTYYTFISMLHYKFLFNYLQLWQSYATLSETTHQIFDIALDLNLKVCLLSKWHHCWRHVISNTFVDII